MKSKLLAVVLMAIAAAIVLCPPVLKVSPVLDLGRRDVDKEHTYFWRIRNRGLLPAYVSDISSSCGCTRPLLSSVRIAPLAEVDIPFRIYVGSLDSDIKVTIGAESRILWQSRLSTIVSAHAHKEIIVSPATIVTLPGDAYPDDFGVREISIQSQQRKITQAKVLNTEFFIKNSIKQIDGNRVVVSISLVPCPQGDLNIPLRIHCELEDGYAIEELVTIRGSAGKRSFAEPSLIFAQSMGEDLKQQFQLSTAFDLANCKSYGFDKPPTITSIGGLGFQIAVTPQDFRSGKDGSVYIQTVAGDWVSIPFLSSSN